MSLGPGCADEPAVVGACAVVGDCPERQVCVLLGPDGAEGACVTPMSTPGFPSTGNNPVELDLFNELDVLFVIDDSPAIAPRLPQLAEAMTAFAAALQATKPQPSLRFGVTTTDAGNPRCAAAEVGALRMESCRARLDEFADADAGVDAREACTAACSLPSLGLTPTLGLDGEVAVRPWLEVAGNWDNLPDGVDLAEALRCAVPQGVAGCEFTSPLASLERAVARSEDEADPAYGFLRETADLLVVVVSAGNDCSVAPGHEAIFSDNQVFWGDLQLPELSPGICWRAGVVCDGPGPVYDDCRPIDRGDDGAEASPEQAVLTPAQHFAEMLQYLQLLRQTFDLRARVRLFSVAGVPPEGQAVPYADADEPGFQTQHGIGPGCSDTVAAPPPVRLLAADDATELEELPAASICEADWSDAFTQVAGVASENLGPSCYPRCVRDWDPETPGLDPVCDVSAVNLALRSWDPVPPCVRVDGEWASQGGSPRCYIVRTDDELDPRCAEEGYNLALELWQSEPNPPGTYYQAWCRESPNPYGDCPEL
ncbi:hypothetical protein OV203_13210 [Nannocystis sp. ILAH1]|uniref:hypothetical protein n=1 Tax=Nannocystis sp. ILAH1 TaxID=2996789 RepID=UPI00226F721A|nr:hypothetical protein [Nannocystis sp. ILAH1]MCY0988090.1 hypothetical protein [Nannocystis sp. ILAH1]